MLRTTHSLYNALKTAKLGPHSTDTIVARREIEHDEASDISRTDPYARTSKQCQMTDAATTVAIFLITPRHVYLSTQAEPPICESLVALRKCRPYDNKLKLRSMIYPVPCHPDGVR
jgi:hypothetical protein